MFVGEFMYKFLAVELALQGSYRDEGCVESFAWLFTDNLEGKKKMRRAQ